jgi:hypothetical protein
MAKQAKDHDPANKPGKTVSDAIGSRVEGDEPASDAPHVTAPRKAKERHPESQRAGIGASAKVPGKAVPGAIRGRNKR